MSAVVTERSVADQALEMLRHAGNPFRNYFARNPDDEVCARFHVSELFARQREQLLGVVNLYRYDSQTHSEVVPVLGNKGAGKTHLLHSIKHGQTGAWQLLVTPGTFQKDAEFLEYLLFQIIDTLLGGAIQNGARPLDFVSDGLTRRLLHQALSALSAEELRELFPATGLVRWAQKLGLGGGQAQERAKWLLDHLARPMTQTQRDSSVRQVCADCRLAPERAWELVRQHIERSESHNTAGLMRRQIHENFARAALLGDEGELAGFLTYGFAELEFNVRPSRQDLVLALLKVLMDIFLGLKMPVVVAFDQLEDLLLARRDDGGQRTAEAFFAGIVQAMHQVDGICFVVFAERGLWNRFIPSLDGYIQDRLSNPIHVPGQGTIKAVRLEAPAPELVRRVVEIRLQSALAELAGAGELSPIFPFTDEQIHRIARTEPTLRDMLQQFRHLFDHLVFADPAPETANGASQAVQARVVPSSELPPTVKSAVIVETSIGPATNRGTVDTADLGSLGVDLGASWEQVLQAARQQLEPEGALTGATRELQTGLGAFLQLCHEHGVKVGPWRLQHVAAELAFGEHPTYGVISIAHWACKDGQPWKVGVGLFLGRGPGKPKDLETKLAALEVAPPIIDHLILLRPEDDLSLTGKSKTLWQEAERRSRHARLEPINLDALAILYGFPRFLTALSETLPDGQPLPNLADFLQERCEKLLEQICMPVCP
jgi:hypothetical protein